MMNVHEFGMAIRENRNLYTDEEYYQLCLEWKKEYEKYLLDKFNL